ncbi:hypothetical protein [Pseudoalteromonas sp. B62]|uniref:hypothetical protein n=1 Tax=Pseudoalteromonas sp. B62 TaxID=630483 RepID=UPI00301D7238
MICLNEKSFLDILEKCDGVVSGYKFQTEIDFSKIKLTKDIKFKRCEFKKITYSNTTIKYGFLFDKCNINTLTISNVIFKEQIVINSNIKELLIGGANTFSSFLIQRGGEQSKAPKISTLRMTGEIRGRIHITCTKINYADFSSLHSYAHFTLQMLECKRIKFHFFVNESGGFFHLMNLVSNSNDSRIYLGFSIFKNTKFTNCNFDSFTTFYVNNNDFSDLISQG